MATDSASSDGIWTSAEGHAAVVSQTEEEVVVLVAGELDDMLASRLRSVLSPLLEIGSRIVIDIAAVTFIDSAGVGLLAGIAHRMSSAGRSLVIRGPRRSVVRVLELTGLVKVLTIEAEVPESRSSSPNGWRSVLADQDHGSGERRAAGGFGVHRRCENGRWIAVLWGELDLGGVDILSHALDDLTQPGSVVVVDMERLDFIGSSGIGALIVAMKQARSLGGDIALRSLSPFVRRVFEVAGADRVFTVLTET
jgi:anti-sigma B factor antagonist